MINDSLVLVMSLVSLTARFKALSKILKTSPDMIRVLIIYSFALRIEVRALCGVAWLIESNVGRANVE